jgi:tetratricopeptide (TPR) repeat protein/tRNA A-37 threonylcarbamoyl transferase component Bud32
VQWQGERLGRYVILGVLGEGGMGRVYAAFDAELGRKVAVKVLHQRMARGEESLEARGRLFREAQAMAKLSHPHVVAIHDVGTVDGDVFLAMEYMGGGTLSEWLKTPRLWRKVLEVMTAAGRGLAAAHEAGLIHRDFKPDNVLFGKDGRPRVTDFGIARARGEGDAAGSPATASLKPKPGASQAPTAGRADPESTYWVSPSAGESTASPSTVRTMTGSILGTPGYMAPEQLFGDGVDARSDQFSFCVAAYQALYGEKPFTSKSLEDYAEALSRPVRPPPPGTRVPGWVRRVLIRGLSADAAARYPSMEALIAALESDPWIRRRRWMAVGAVALAGAVSATAWARHQHALRARCSQGPALVGEAWNPTVAAGVSAALERAGGPLGDEVVPRVTAKLDEFARDWASSYRAVSEATLIRGEQSAATLERRLQCLERGRAQLAALAEVLSSADESLVQHAPDAAYALPSPAKCSTSDVATMPDLPASPELRRRALAIDREIARGSALVAAGADLQAEELVEHAIAEATAIPYRRAEAELLFIAGQAREGRGDYVGALPRFKTGVHAAERAGDDLLATRAAAQVAFVLSAYLGKPQEGGDWIDLAESFAERAGRDDAIDAAVLDARIVVTAMLGHPERALELHDREIALFERAYGPGDPRVATAFMNRGVTEMTLGLDDRAVEDDKRAIELLSAATGPRNPHLDLPWYNLGDALGNLGRPEEARAAYERVLALQAGRPAGTLTVQIYGNLADLQLGLGDPDSALRLAEQGLDVAGQADERGLSLWAVLVARAQARGQKGDAAGKAEDCARVLAEQRAQGAMTSEGVYYPDALTCLGEVELAAHRASAAIAYLEESVFLEKRQAAAVLPLAKFTLARALRLAGRDPARARALADDARAALAGLPGQAKELAAIDAWLAEGKAAGRKAVGAP